MRTDADEWPAMHAVMFCISSLYELYQRIPMRNVTSTICTKRALSATDISAYTITACMLYDCTSPRGRRLRLSHVKRCIQPDRVACVYTVH